MMDMTHAAIYARVSSEQQAEANTIASQIAALQARVAADGLPLLPDHHFLDEGYSGATLIRPALERLRDAAALGQITRLYVHSPDRLARKYAYQVLLIDELQRAGVEVIFLNRELGRSPEDDLLLQVQGMVAEYERAKILERSRRGKRHAAQTGEVSVLSTAPYGYHYVRKQDGGGVARFEVVLHEARVVRQVFAWVGRDRLSIGEVCRRLKQTGEPTRTGKATWHAQEPSLHRTGGLWQDAVHAPRTAVARPAQWQSASTPPGQHDRCGGGEVAERECAGLGE
jgi:site-specific DNA recombinase